MDAIMVENIRQLHQMIVDAGLEKRIDLMEDGGLNSKNIDHFIGAGMTVGEFSSPFLKGAHGKFAPGSGEITAAVQKLRAEIDKSAQIHRTENGLGK